MTTPFPFKKNAQFGYDPIVETILGYRVILHGIPGSAAGSPTRRDEIPARRYQEPDYWAEVPALPGFRLPVCVGAMIEDVDALRAAVTAAIAKEQAK